MTRMFILAGLATLASVGAQAAAVPSAIVVPEPTSVLFLAAGVAVLAARFRRR